MVWRDAGNAGKTFNDGIVDRRNVDARTIGVDDEHGVITEVRGNKGGALCGFVRDGSGRCGDSGGFVVAEDVGEGGASAEEGDEDGGDGGEGFDFGEKHHVQGSLGKGEGCAGGGGKGGGDGCGRERRRGGGE